MFVARHAMLVALIFLLPGSFTALADSHEHDMHQHEHDMHQMEPMDQMDHSGHRGANIHNSSVDGHSLAYHLIDLREKMKDMEDMPEMQATHHMMMYVVGPDGAPVAEAQVGYLVIGPDGNRQRLMAMGMQDGFGADVDFKAAGTYTVRTKAVAGDTTLLDEFAYEVQ
ncbi:MAG: hypothetical protein OXP66_16400 [Candidatus Tectomicrobia bacterium]|nr:hypothetical protein [Candidatus Tectomicrobia bacterium]